MATTLSIFASYSYYKDLKNNVPPRISLANLIFAGYFIAFFLFLMIFGSVIPVLSSKLTAIIRKAITTTQHPAVRDQLIGFAYEIMEKEVYFRAGLVSFDWTLGLSVKYI